jgi:hypothetical protein
MRQSWLPAVDNDTEQGLLADGLSGPGGNEPGRVLPKTCLERREMTDRNVGLASLSAACTPQKWFASSFFVDYKRQLLDCMHA